MADDAELELELQRETNVVDQNKNTGSDDDDEIDGMSRTAIVNSDGTHSRRDVRNVRK